MNHFSNPRRSINPSIFPKFYNPKRVKATRSNLVNQSVQFHQNSHNNQQANPNRSKKTLTSNKIKTLELRYSQELQIQPNTQKSHIKTNPDPSLNATPRPSPQTIARSSPEDADRVASSIAGEDDREEERSRGSFGRISFNFFFFFASKQY